jgi:hypothetical protein
LSLLESKVAVVLTELAKLRVEVFEDSKLPRDVTREESIATVPREESMDSW